VESKAHRRGGKAVLRAGGSFTQRTASVKATLRSLENCGVRDIAHARLVLLFTFPTTSATAPILKLRDRKPRKVPFVAMRQQVHVDADSIANSSASCVSFTMRHSALEHLAAQSEWKKVANGGTRSLDRDHGNSADLLQIAYK
jgi:hypothetical protein